MRYAPEHLGEDEHGIPARAADVAAPGPIGLQRHQTPAIVVTSLQHAIARQPTVANAVLPPPSQTAAPPERRSDGADLRSFLSPETLRTVVGLGVSNAALVSALARQPVDAPPAPAPKLELVFPSSFGVGGDVIKGPLAAGDHQEHAGLTVEQTSPLEARITYGDSTVTIRADDGGQAYSFVVGPPGPEHEPELPSFGSSGLIHMPDPDEPKVLPQRVVRVTAMSGVRVDWRPDPALERPPLVMHERFVGSPDDVYELGMGFMLDGDVLEWQESDHTTLRLDKTMLRINANSAPDAGAPSGEARAPRRTPTTSTPSGPDRWGSSDRSRSLRRRGSPLRGARPGLPRASTTDGS